MNSTGNTYISRARTLAPELKTILMFWVLALLGYIVYQLVNSFIDLRDRSYLKEDAGSILDSLSRNQIDYLQTFKASNICLTVFDIINDNVVVCSCNKEDEGHNITSNQKTFIESLKGLGVESETVQTKRYGNGPGGKAMKLISTAMVRENKVFLLES